MNTLDARRRLLGRNVYKKTVEGNPAIAQGSLARMYPKIEMQGWTEQAQYEGNQLFDVSKITSSNVEVSGNNVILKSYSVNLGLAELWLKPDTEYTLSFIREDNQLASSGGSSLIDISGGGGQTISLMSPGVGFGQNTFTTPSDLSNYGVYLYGYNDGTEYTVKSIMLNEGSTALPWEPYTGGAPSPSPEYPQEIVSAGNWNEETQKWEYEVKLTGKNLFDAEYFRTTLDWKLPADMNGYPYIPIYIGKGNKITISTDGTPAEGLGFYCTVARTNKNTSNNIYTWLYHSTNVKLIKTNVSFGVVEDDYIYFSLNVGHDNIEKFLNAFPNFQIEISAQKTDYQPYKEQTVLLTSDRPLTKWDRLEKRGDQWGWVYKSNRVILDGTENFNDDYLPTIIFPVVKQGVYTYNPSGGPLYDIFSNYSPGLMWSNVSRITCSVDLNLYGFSDIGIDSEETFKSWLQQKHSEGNPFEYWYETAEETFTPLSESEQEQMNALHTFRPTTVLSNDCECEMTLTYKTKKSLEVTT